jgi:hypothetical protein
MFPRRADVMAACSAISATYQEDSTDTAKFHTDNGYRDFPLLSRGTSVAARPCGNNGGLHGSHR